MHLPVLFLRDFPYPPDHASQRHSALSFPSFAAISDEHLWQPEPAGLARQPRHVQARPRRRVRRPPLPQTHLRYVLQTMRFMIKFGIDLMSPFYTGDGASDLAHNLGAAKLVSHPSGLFTVAVCVMSNYRDENEWLLHLTTELSRPLLSSMTSQTQKVA